MFSTVFLCSKHKSALNKYKNKLNEKEAQLKQTEHGLQKVKKESTTKLLAAEDDVRKKIV